ncbi:MAG: DUF4097 family beta strand repeat-containing protein [Gemmatimonadota bacterium]
MKPLKWSLIGMAVFAVTATFAVAQMGGWDGVFGSDDQELRVSNVGEGQSAENFQWSGRVASGESVEIKGVNGSISVSRASGSEVEVVAEARGRKSDPSTVRIERVEHADGVTFCAVYPSRNDNRENYCGAGDDGRMNVQDNDVSVHFEIRVPDDVVFIGKTVNGDIEAYDLGSDVFAETVNGSIEIDTDGFAEAETVNGSIDAVLGADVRQGVEFSTVNGSITLDLPDDIDASIDASWLNGSFETAIPFATSGRVSRRSAQGTLGDGGPELELSTVNGSIEIR